MIAIKNLYYLLLYAWDVLDPAGEMEAIDAEPETDLVNLLARVLTQGVGRLLRRGADRGYVPQEEALRGIRGKIDLSGTVKANLAPQARAACRFDELSHDVPHNRILKATLRQLLRVEKLHGSLRETIRRDYLRFPGVADVPLDRWLFNRVQLHRNLRPYRMLLGISRLLHRRLMPVDASGALRFTEFWRSKRRMHRLFERFLFRFYEAEQAGFKVLPRRLRWAETTAETDASNALLPTLNPDLWLTRPGQTIILDAKYYREPLQVHPSGRWTLRSGHLYQLFAYLRNAVGESSSRVEGILLYAESGEPLDVAYSLHGHRVRACTINLMQPWRGIRKDLLALVPAS
jgi:5-methylcytosine-specific restriction enzyme subunit McrC